MNAQNSVMDGLESLGSAVSQAISEVCVLHLCHSIICIHLGAGSVDIGGGTIRTYSNDRTDSKECQVGSSSVCMPAPTIVRLLLESATE